MAKKITKKKTKKKLSVEEKAQLKEQRDQKREIRDILRNIGFERLNYIDGKEFKFDGRTSEIDDIFINENIILITEYTIGDTGNHLLKKSIFYNKINSDVKAFIDFAINEEKLLSFKKFYEEKIKSKYSINQLRLKIIYCAKKSISKEHKDVVSNVVFFDYSIVQYFKSLSKVIKKSSKYEFLDFLGINFSDFADNIIGNGQTSINKFFGHILPEEKSSFKDGYKIISFYIDADSLMKRAYVLRQEGWRDQEGIGYYQRMFEGKKISSMRKYLTDKKRVFINNIISTISEDQIKLYDNDKNLLKINADGQFVGNDSTTKVTPTLIEINDECNIIGLVDGQHRTYAYHEGDDLYEKEIAKKRKIQNLLVTGILFPHNESKLNRLKFEANLFLEINSNQKNVHAKLKQEIELMLSPFSNVAMAKRILQGLNVSGPLLNRIEQFSYEKGKIKTASIVSFGLRPLIKLDDVKSKDSLFLLWTNPNKQKLAEKDSQEFELLTEYINFSVATIRELLIAFKSKLDHPKWNLYSPKTPTGIITVTFINGLLNVLRLLIENGHVGDFEFYKNQLENIDTFDFKSYKSSQYRKMGEDIYDKYFSGKTLPNK
ncbi:MAG: DGQHR domain-containing [Bacteroidetes bacterium]|nr:MAG: DGQHR domain-containing [Bacteroidota bacterium]